MGVPQLEQGFCVETLAHAWGCMHSQLEIHIIYFLPSAASVIYAYIHVSVCAHATDIHTTCMHAHAKTEAA